MKIDKRSMETKASPETLWRIWSDTSTWGEWNPNVASMSLDGPFASGTTGTMKTQKDSRSVTITGVEPGRSFDLETSPVPLTVFSFHCEIAPGDSGMSTISQGVTMRGPLAPVFSPLIGNQVANTFPAVLSALAAKAEAEESKNPV